MGKTLMPVPENCSGNNHSNLLSQALPQSVKHSFETRLGHDFSDVKVHENNQPTLMGAQAFTQGSDIFFAPGKYQPLTPDGQQLLGHELTHVVQQNQGKSLDVPKGLAESDSNPAVDNNE